MSKKNIFLNVDYFDMQSTFYEKFGRCFDSQDIDMLFEKAASNGVTHINWRSRIAGLNCYHSKILPPIVGGYDTLLQKGLMEALKKHDPLSEARKLSSKHGLKLFAWGDFFDCWLVGMDDPNMLANLHWHMMRYDGLWAMPGIPCYNEPELRSYMLEIYREQLDYNIDGLFINTSNTHSTMFPMYFRDNQKHQFGYNEPVKAEYKKRAGVELDYPAHQPELLADILAEGLDEMIRMTGNICHEKKAEFIIMTSREDTLLPPAKDLLNIANHDRKWMEWSDTLSQLAIEIHPFAPEQVGNTPHCLEDGKLELAAWVTIWKDHTPEQLRQVFENILTNPRYKSLVLHEAITLMFPETPCSTPPLPGVKTSEQAWNMLRQFA